MGVHDRLEGIQQDACVERRQLHYAFPFLLLSIRIDLEIFGVEGAKNGVLIRNEVAERFGNVARPNKVCKDAS